MAITDIKLSGKLFTDAGTAVNGATVALLETGTSTQEVSTTTDSNGAWSFTETSLDTTYDIKISSGSSVRYIMFSDEMTVKGLDTASLKVRGTEGAAAPIYLLADQADNDIDVWRINAADGGVLTFDNRASGSSDSDLTAQLTITPNATLASSVVAVAGDLTVGDDLSLTSDSAVFNMGASNDFTITHDGTTGATIAGNPVTITAAGASTWSTSSGALTITSAAALNLNPAGGSVILLDGTINVDAGVVTGATSITSTAFVGTIDGVVGGNTPAAITGTTIDANTDFTVGSTVITDDSIVMTPSTSDTITIAGATNGALNITTVDNAAAAANIQITADGTAELAGTTVTLDSAGDIELEATNDINVPTDVGMTFGDDGEKIEGDGTDLTIASSAKLNLSATSDVHVPKNVGIVFDDNASEKIESNNTGLTINSGADINLTATGDVNMPANVGITFGDDAEKIEGDGTDLTISGNNINLTATADVVIPANVGITFGSGEKIEGDSTDLTVTSGADINLTATSDINVPADVGITFGDDAEKIEGDGTDLTIAGNIINLTPADNVKLNGNVGIGVGANTVGTDFAVTTGGGDYNGTNIVSLQVGTSAGTKTTRGFVLVQGTTDAAIIFGDSGGGSDDKKMTVLYQGGELDLGRIDDSAKAMNSDDVAIAIEATDLSVKISNGDLNLNNNDLLNVGASGNDWTGTLLSLQNTALLKIGATTAHGTTAGTNLISLFNGTAPAGTLTNGASFFCASGEMKVIDAAGNITVLSPHDDNNQWVFHSKNSVTGKVLHIHMEKLMRRLDEELGGGFIEEFLEV